MESATPGLLIGNEVCFIWAVFGDRFAVTPLLGKPWALALIGIMLTSNALAYFVVPKVNVPRSELVVVPVPVVIDRDPQESAPISV